MSDGFSHTSVARDYHGPCTLERPRYYLESSAKVFFLFSFSLHRKLNPPDCEEKRLSVKTSVEGVGLKQAGQSKAGFLHGAFKNWRLDFTLTDPVECSTCLG